VEGRVEGRGLSPPGRPFDDDVWELYNLDEDFAETRDLAQTHPDKLAELQADWWALAEASKVLPLDDRFGPRFAENAARYHGPRKRFTFYRGMGHLPTECAPDVRSRSYRIEADVTVGEGDEGVLLSHGDATCGYSLYLRDGYLCHTLNVGGALTTVVSDRPVAPGRHLLGVRCAQGDGRTYSLTIDGEAAGSVHTFHGFATMISFSGLDIGLDRGSPVADYAAPFAFSGKLRKVTVVMDEDQSLDDEAVGATEMARQ